MNPSFEVLESGHGTTTQDATVSIDDGDVTVRGTIVGKDGGTTATLADASYDADAGTLTVRIGTEPDDSAGDFVTMALLGIEYRVVVALESSPETVVVEHEGVESWRTTVSTD